MRIKLGKTIKEINNYLAENAQFNTKNMGNGLKLYMGDPFNTTMSIVSQIAPMSKVGIVCRKQTYSDGVELLSDEIKRLGGKALSVILPRKVTTIESMSKMFALPDDVRLIVVTDVEVIRPACYYASIAKVPVVLMCEDERFFEKFSLHTFVYSGEKLDYVLTACECHVIVNVKKFLKTTDFAELYGLTMSKLPAIFDYHVTNATRGEKLNEKAYSAFIESIKTVYSVFNYRRRKQKKLLLAESLKILACNYMTEGKMFDFSSQRLAELLLNKSDKNGHGRVFCAGLLLKLYGLYISGEYSHLLEVPDYMARSEKVAKLLKAEEKPFMVGISLQLDTFRRLAEQEIDLFPATVNLDSELYDCTDRLINTYYALGGKNFARKEVVARAVKYSGDVGDFINGASVVRESGILEILGKFI